MDDTPRPPRRKRYSGKNPRRFEDKYKELNPERYAETIGKVLESGKTPAGMHVPIMVEECLDGLRLVPGQAGIDATLGYGGHAREILARISPGGRLIGLDVDPIEQPKTAARLRAAGFDETAFVAVRSNYAGIRKVLDDQGLRAVDFIFADLGCSSMQFDDPSRGFTFKTEGPLDMRMNPERGVSAAEWLAKAREAKLAEVLLENADETFHSGEDRRVKKAFQAGERDGLYAEVSDGVITAGPEERHRNPRSIPAKLRWAVLARERRSLDRHEEGFGPV